MAPSVPLDDFSDLLPGIAQPDAPNCLVPIAYTAQYKEAMDLFRAIVAKKEYSERVLVLTEVLIRLNPGHFSIWAYRAQTLKETGADLTAELQLMDQLIKEHLKNYQVWQHRRVIVTSLDSSALELGFTTKALGYDSKNYHTWAYRQWVLCHFFSSSSSGKARPSDVPSTSTAAADKAAERQVWADERAYTARLIEDDVRNNSAWNQRFWACFESDDWAVLDDEGKAKRLADEVEFARTWNEKVPNNASGWGYLRGLLTVQTSAPVDPTSLLSWITPLASTSPIAEGDERTLPSLQALEYLLDFATERKDRENAAKELAERDPVRKGYWAWALKEL